MTIIDFNQKMTCLSINNDKSDNSMTFTQLVNIKNNDNVNILIINYYKH